MEIKVNVRFDNPRQMYDEDSRPMDKEKFQTLFLEKVEDVLQEYVDSGLESDFVISEFGDDDAEDFKYYGDVEVKFERTK